MINVVGHHFIGGVYIKDLFILQDSSVVTHKHAYDHASILLSGCVIVETSIDNGEIAQETYWSPAIIEIKAGINHSVTAVNAPAHWLCIHRTDCDNINDIDEVLIETPK